MKQQNVRSEWVLAITATIAVLMVFGWVFIIGRL